MKTMKRLLTGLLLCLPLLAPAMAADTASEQAIPLKIFSHTVELRRNLTHADLKTTLSAIIKDEASVDTDKRLQYDVQLVPDSAPTTFVFDFDKKGVIKSITVDSYLKKQNPSVTALLSWLTQHAGKPDVKSKRKTVWKNFAGWKIEHEEGGSGEDSVYRIELSAR
jgi:hypothetical protein